MLRRVSLMLPAALLMAVIWTPAVREQVAAQQDDDSLAVGSALLRLGMDETAARHSLADYELGQSGEPDTAIPIADPHEPKRVIGSVEFQHGKVMVIGRYWDIDPRRPLDAVIGAVTSLHESCAGKVTTEASHSVTPDLSDDSVKIRCGVREILIDSLTYKGRFSSSVSETLILGK